MLPSHFLASTHTSFPMNILIPIANCSALAGALWGLFYAGEQHAHAFHV